MRTKTIVLLAAAGVAGVVTASAQVYSVNVVGYVNTEVKAGFNLLANPLDNKNTDGNAVANLITGIPDESFLYKYTGGTYTINNFDFGEWTDPAMTLVPGEGFWLELPPAAAPVTITFVGEVKQGTLTTPMVAGFNLVGSQVPQAGLLSTDLGYPAADEDFVYTYKDGAYTIYNYDFGEWTTPPGEPTIGVGEGFWAEKVAAVDWVRTFSVN